MSPIERSLTSLLEAPVSPLTSGWTGQRMLRPSNDINRNDVDLAKKHLDWRVLDT